MAEQGSAPGEFVARCVWVVVGVLVIGLGSGSLKAIDVGVDPYTAANIGISTLLGWDLGSYLSCSATLRCSSPCSSGVASASASAVSRTWRSPATRPSSSRVHHAAVPDEPAPVLKMILFVMGICVFALGASLYMTAALGTAPTTRSRR